MGPTRNGYVLLTAGIVFGCFGIGSSLISSYPMIRLAGVTEPAQQRVGSILAENRCPTVYSEFSKQPDPLRKLAAYFYGVGAVFSDYYSDESDLQRAEVYFICALALNRDFTYARSKLTNVQSRLGLLDVAEPYTRLPARQNLQGKVNLAQVQDLFQQSRLDLSDAQRSSLVFDTALNAIIARDDQALELAEKSAREMLNQVKKDEVLIVPRTAAQLAFNLGFVRLALGQFDAGREAYRVGLQFEFE